MASIAFKQAKKYILSLEEILDRVEPRSMLAAIEDNLLGVMEKHIGTILFSQ